ncbi:MAG: nickel-dependent hydrogenase large subunit [Clostridia bacterium]|nr:nickel-dependent hydrogenase large subunit [Clostridia bacterium]
MARIVIDPVTRIEGHLKLEVVVEGGEVKEARSSGMLFRGIENILRGRDPRDALVITQRICGVCPQSHGIAAVRCLDDAFGVSDKIPANGILMRNLIQGAHDVQDHILHFYHLAALDYIDVTAVASYEGRDPVLCSLKDFAARGELGPFVPRYEGDYRFPAQTNRELVAHYAQALEIRRKGQEMVALLGGKVPHSVGVIPGGVTEQPTVDKIASFLWRLRELQSFIDNVYLPDVLAVARTYPDYLEIGRGCGLLLSYGAYPEPGGETLFAAGLVDRNLVLEPLDVKKIVEDVSSSWYEQEAARYPGDGETKPQPGKAGAYSWLKAPRYAGRVCEVGPLAHIAVSYAAGRTRVKELVDWALRELGAGADRLFSVAGRHLARALATKLIAEALERWLLQLEPGRPAAAEYLLPRQASGMGLTEAARGALGHWIRIEDYKIAGYQCVVPTTWNGSPRDGQGQPGALEQALTGIPVKDPDNPFEVVRVVRSFDPCLACAVHLLTPGGSRLSHLRVG